MIKLQKLLILYNTLTIMCFTIGGMFYMTEYKIASLMFTAFGLICMIRHTLLSYEVLK